MLLSNVDIRNELHSGRLRIGGIRPDAIQPASVDLYLENLRAPLYDSPIRDTMALMAHGFLLASTHEVIGLPSNIAGRVEGVSTWGRQGLIPHTAGFIDPGFYGHITLELVNVSGHAIRLERGMRICQIAFYYTKTAANPSYDGRYQFQGDEPTNAKEPK